MDKSTQFSLPMWEIVWKNVSKITPITTTGNNDKKCLYNFVNAVSRHINLHSIGPEWVATYMHYQLARLLNYDQIKTYSGKIDCPSIFGEKALEFFWNRDPKGRWLTHYVKAEITPEIIKQWVNWPTHSTLFRGVDMVESSVHQRAQKVDVTRRIDFCLIQTTLYKESDATCVTCSVAKNCLAKKQQLFSDLTAKRAKAKKVAK